jgi:hypothetical protein
LNSALGKLEAQTTDKRNGGKVGGVTKHGSLPSLFSRSASANNVVGVGIGSSGGGGGGGGLKPSNLSSVGGKKSAAATSPQTGPKSGVIGSTLSIFTRFGSSSNLTGGAQQTSSPATSTRASVVANAVGGGAATSKVSPLHRALSKKEFTSSDSPHAHLVKSNSATNITSLASPTSSSSSSFSSFSPFGKSTEKQPAHQDTFVKSGSSPLRTTLQHSASSSSIKTQAKTPSLDEDSTCPPHQQQQNQEETTDTLPPLLPNNPNSTKRQSSLTSDRKSRDQAALNRRLSQQSPSSGFGMGTLTVAAPLKVSPEVEKSVTELRALLKGRRECKSRDKKKKKKKKGSQVLTKRCIFIVLHTLWFLFSPHRHH